MLSSRNRFHGHGSLRYIYAKGSIVRSKTFILKYSVNHRRHQPRVAVVISKKVMKSAVKRNRIRRRLYEAVRQLLPVMNQQTDVAIIVTSPELLTMTAPEVVLAVGQAIVRAGLSKPPKN